MTAATRFNPADQARRAMIAKVKIAQKELRLDDVAYRAMLQRITGQSSASTCNVGQLADVLDEMKAKGWTPYFGRHPGRSAAESRDPASRAAALGPGSAAPSGMTKLVAAADHPAAGKARALWISLYQLGVVRDRRETALEAFAARQLKVERLQWADQGQVYKLIEALKAMAERAGWSQAGDLDAIKARLAALIDKRRREADAG